MKKNHYCSAVSKQKYTLITIQGYELMTPEGNLMKSTAYHLIENDPQVALDRAKKLGKHANYRVAEVTEYYAK
jgi:hypothetical protein